MTIINALHLTYILPYLTKESIITSLGNQQKKILMVAALAFSCLVAAFALKSYYKIKSGNKEELEEQEELLKPNQADIADTIISSLTQGAAGFRIETHVEPLEAICSIEMIFENGEIKKKFIIKNSTNTPIDDDLIIQQAHKIQELIEGEFREDLGTLKSFSVGGSFKGKKDHFTVSPKARLFRGRVH